MTPNAIVVIDDNPDDFFSIERTLRQAGLGNPLLHCDEPEQALDQLRRAADSGTPPMLVLLDINMPGMSGTELLAELRRDPRMEWLPVLMLTSSNDDGDVLAAFNGRANAWMSKPLSYGNLTQALQRVRSHRVERVDRPGEMLNHTLSICRIQ